MADANSHMPCHAHAVLCHGLEKSLQNSIVVAWHGRGMACANQTWSHCVNQMGKTQSNPLVAWHDMAGEQHGHGMGTAWEWHGMCELTFNIT
jgi:hypothetical protein